MERARNSMKRLIDCINGYKTIAVTGMCKNAGKTTAVNYLVNNLYTGCNL